MNDLIKKFLSSRKIAVVGASDNPQKYGYRIYRNLKSRGYEVYPVNNKSETVDGDRVYASVSVLPGDVEAIDIVVPPAAAVEVIREGAARGIRQFWLQPGAESPESIELGKQLGVSVIHSVCVMVEK